MSSPVARGYAAKHALLLGFLLADIFIDAYADSTASVVSTIFYLSFQLILRILSLFLILLMMWSTFVFRYGLIGVLCKRFKYLMTFLSISLIFTISLRVVRLVKVIQNESVNDLWKDNSVHGLYILHNLVNVGYYVCVLHAGYDFGNPALYSATTWLEK